MAEGDAHWARRCKACGKVDDRVTYGSQRAAEAAVATVSNYGNIEMEKQATCQHCGGKDFEAVMTSA